MAEETATFDGRIIIDATRRQGMSGSPVIMRERKTRPAAIGTIHLRIFGNYASSETECEAERGQRLTRGYDDR
jgi:hypothetical protein